MTNQPDRIDQIEATLLRVATQQEVNTTGIAELKNTVNSLVQIVTLHQNDLEASQRNFETIQGNIEAMQGEIRGLQLENRRMLEELSSQRDE